MNKQMISETEAVCAAEDMPLTAYLETTYLNLTECQIMLDNIFAQVIGYGAPKAAEDKCECMMDQIIKIRDKSDILMSGLKELCRRLGV